MNLCIFIYDLIVYNIKRSPQSITDFWFTCIQLSYAHYTYIFCLINFCEKFKSYIINTNCECIINNHCVSENTRQIKK